MERHPGMCHLQPRSELGEVSEPWGREWQENPLSLPDHSHLPMLLLGDPKSEAGRAASTQINHLIACFLVTNPVSSASAAVACPVKQHESQGNPQQQSWLIKVRISMVGFLHLMAEHHHSYLPAVGMLLAVPLVPQIPGLCFTFPGHLTSCGHSQHHCLKPHVLCVLWLGNTALGAEPPVAWGLWQPMAVSQRSQSHQLSPSFLHAPGLWRAGCRCMSTVNYCLPSGGHGDRAESSRWPPTGSLHHAGQPDHSA